MKKTIGLFAMLAFVMNVFAQQPVAPEKKDAPAQVQQKTDAKVKEGISFKSGKVWMNKDGKATVLDKEVTLTNGTKVTPSGNVIMKDGAKTMLKEGDFVSMEGVVERKAPVKEKSK